MTKEQIIKELKAMVQGYCSPAQREAIMEAMTAVESGAHIAKDIWEVSFADFREQQPAMVGSSQYINDEKEVKYILLPVGSDIRKALDSAITLAINSATEGRAVYGVRHLGMGRLPR